MDLNRFPLTGHQASNSRNAHYYLDTRGLPANSGRCQCTTCGAYFSSDYSFTKHRSKGSCLTESEMLDKGMVLNKDDWWISEQRVFAEG